MSDTTALSEVARIARDRFGCGAGNGWWGKVKAWIVNGAPSLDEGIAAAAQISRWQVELDNAIDAAKAQEPK